MGACKVVGFVPGSVGYGITERGWLVAKLVWRVKLVAEFDAGETTELEVARIERDGQTGLAGLGLRLAEAKQLTAAIQAEIVPAPLNAPRTIATTPRRSARPPAGRACALC
jgi:hypothetical protein